MPRSPKVASSASGELTSWPENDRACRVATTSNPSATSAAR